MTVSQPTLPKVKATYSSRHFWVPVSKYEIEPRAQRKFDPGWANKIAAEFDPDALGLPFVWETTNGDGQARYVVIDGQHRFAATKIAMGDDQRIECEVVSGITLERAAQLYRKRNKIRLPRPIDEFLAGVTGNDPECVNINSIVETAGYHISRTAGGNNVGAIASLRRAYRMAPDGSLLREALSVIASAWTPKDSGIGDVIVATALVLRRYHDIDLKRLIKRLSEEPGGAEGFIGRGMKVRDIIGHGLVQGIAHAIVLTYNHGQPAKKRLAEWGSRED